jgi:hypothetical protein
MVLYGSFPYIRRAGPSFIFAFSSLLCLPINSFLRETTAGDSRSHSRHLSALSSKDIKSRSRPVSIPRTKAVSICFGMLSANRLYATVCCYQQSFFDPKGIEVSNGPWKYALTSAMIFSAESIAVSSGTSLIRSLGAIPWMPREANADMALLTYCHW